MQSEGRNWPNFHRKLKTSKRAACRFLHFHSADREKEMLITPETTAEKMNGKVRFTIIMDNRERGMFWTERGEKVVVVVVVVCRGVGGGGGEAG